MKKGRLISCLLICIPLSYCIREDFSLKLGRNCKRDEQTEKGTKSHLQSYCFHSPSVYTENKLKDTRPNLPINDDLPACLASSIGRNVQLIPQPGHCHLSLCLVLRQEAEQLADSQQKLGKQKASSLFPRSDLSSSCPHLSSYPIHRDNLNLMTGKYRRQG